jgi:hypothetical protein
MDRWRPLLPIGQVALVALAAMAAGAALAGQPGDTAPETIVCVVSGYDVIIYNRSAGPIAPGVSVSWSVPFLRMSGSHELATELEPEGRVFLSGVLGGGGFLSPNQTCIAAFE